MERSGSPRWRCASCSVLACNNEPGSDQHPAYCPMLLSPGTLAEARAAYQDDEELRRLAAAAARTEAAGYCRDTRIEEIIAFARRIGATHLGLACCIGLRREAHLAQVIFEAAGLKVSTVICKAGGIPKEEIGLRDQEKIRPGRFEALCNPVAQARLLREVGTELNVVLGLCVGHDSLFFAHSAAPTTVLVAKDRVLGHNPVAALYTSGTYYRRLKQPS